MLLLLIKIDDSTPRFHAVDDILELYGQEATALAILEGWDVAQTKGNVIYSMELRKDAAFHGYLYVSNGSNCQLYLNGRAAEGEAGAYYTIVYLADEENIRIVLEAPRSESPISRPRQVCLCTMESIALISSALTAQVYLTVGVCVGILLFAAVLFIKKSSEKYLLWLTFLAYMTIGRALFATFFEGEDHSVLHAVLMVSIVGFMPASISVQTSLQLLERSLLHAFCTINILDGFLNMRIGRFSAKRLIFIGAAAVLPLIFTPKGYYAALAFDALLGMLRLYIALRERREGSFAAYVLLFAFSLTGALWILGNLSDLSLIRPGFICMALRFKSLISTLLCMTLFIIACERFAQKFKEADRLSGELAGLNAVLEERVAQKTFELKNSYEELQESHKNKAQMVSSMTHNLKTPLCSLDGYANMAAHCVRTAPEKAERYLGIIEKNTKRMMKALDNLLLFSRLEEKHVAFERLCFSLTALLNAVETDSYNGAKEKNIQCRLQIEAGENILWGDSLYLQQAIQNIVDNGIEHGRENGELNISLCRDAAEYSISIRDNGDGIEAQDLPLIFERYYSNHHGKRTSSGLGLSIARSIVEYHGGSITVESRKGEGTCFVIRLPYTEGIGQ